MDKIALLIANNYQDCDGQYKASLSGVNSD